MLNQHSTKEGAAAPTRDVFLILGCSTSSLHHSWNLVHNLINIFCTLLWPDFRFYVGVEVMLQVFGQDSLEEYTTS